MISQTFWLRTEDKLRSLRSEAAVRWQQGEQTVFGVLSFSFLWFLY